MVDPTTLVGFAFKFHGGVTAGSIAAYHVFKPKADVLYGLGEKFDASVLGLRRIITEALSTVLRGVFANPPIVVDTSSEVYRERPGNPVDSDLYRTTLSDFIENHCDAIADYRIIRDHCSNHAYWQGRLSWVLLGLAVWSMICLGGCCFLKAFGMPTAPLNVAWLIRILAGTFAVSIVLIIVVVVIEGLCLRNSQRATELRAKYERLQ